MVELAAGFCIIVALTFAGLLLLTAAKLREARLASAASERDRAIALAVIDTVPLAAFRWPAGCDQDGYSVRTCSYLAFLGELSSGDAAQLEAARMTLKSKGSPFSFTVKLRTGSAFTIEGRRTATGETVLWLLDASAAARAEHAVEEAASLRELMDSIPVPVWRRDCNLVLTDCNQAYASALDATRETVLADGRELVPGGCLARGMARADGLEPRSMRAHIVIGGSRRLMEFVEAPGRRGVTIGFAFDRTDIETAEAELGRHTRAHAAVLESIGAAVAIYGADKRLKFFNAAFAVLWGLETEWLASEPSLGEVLERLRERRRIPERADFGAFKRERLQLFTSLIRPQQELMHLPDDRTLLLSISPHPFGG
ncbi:MAG: PAS domain-containing protein, partial [Alphaproteobacteria bacterium]|nr:PAS domain-containing protein [Alphaproteobacteria bacterium]